MSKSNEYYYQTSGSPLNAFNGLVEDKKAEMNRLVRDKRPDIDSLPKDKIDFIKKFPLSDKAKEFIPCSSSSSPAMNARPMEQIGRFDGNNLNNKFCLTDIMDPLLRDLTYDPGNHCKVCMSISTALDCQGNTVELLKETVDIIVDKSLADANFRYSGCRLLNYLIHELPPVQSKQFLTYLLDRINTEHNKIMNNLLLSDDNQQKLQNYATFLADLFGQIDQRTSTPVPHAVQEKYHPFYKAFMEVCQKLLDNPVINNIKCLSLVLKMTGLEITKFEAIQAKKPSKSPSNQQPSTYDSGYYVPPQYIKTELTKLFEKMRQILFANETSTSIKAILLMLIELKAANWGHSQCPTCDIYEIERQNITNNAQHESPSFISGMEESDRDLIDISQNKQMTEEDILTQDEIDFLIDQDLMPCNQERTRLAPHSPSDDMNLLDISESPVPIIFCGDERGNDIDYVPYSNGGDAKGDPYTNSLDGKNFSPDLPYYTPEGDLDGGLDGTYGPRIHVLNDEEAEAYKGFTKKSSGDGRID